MTLLYSHVFLMAMKAVFTHIILPRSSPKLLNDTINRKSTHGAWIPSCFQHTGTYQATCNVSCFTMNNGTIPHVCETN